MSLVAAPLAGDRLHLQHGPIDLIVGCDGARAAGLVAARTRFEGMLDGLMAEYELLRTWDGSCPRGHVARKMWRAVQAHRGQATPMAAVAGAVAQTVLAGIAQVPGVQRAYVNNGGDIALHLTAGEMFRIATAGSGGRIVIGHGDPVRGIATSGRGGRSLSMGIADAVTVLARDAADADVAATLIANAVDLPGHAGIRRLPAEQVKDDSDLGQRPVVVEVAPLSRDDVRAALTRGAVRADAMRAAGHLVAAALHLQGETRLVGAGQFISHREAEHA